MYSPVFMKMFTLPMKEKNTYEIALPEKAASSFVDFLCMFYPRDQLKDQTSLGYIKESTYVSVAALAHEYASDKVMLSCEKFVHAHLRTSSAAEPSLLDDLRVSFLYKFTTTLSMAEERLLILPLRYFVDHSDQFAQLPIELVLLLLEKMNTTPRLLVLIHIWLLFEDKYRSPAPFSSIISKLSWPRFSASWEFKMIMRLCSELVRLSTLSSFEKVTVTTHQDVYYNIIHGEKDIDDDYRSNINNNSNNNNNDSDDHKGKRKRLSSPESPMSSLSSSSSSSSSTSSSSSSSLSSASSSSSSSSSTSFLSSSIANCIAFHLMILKMSPHVPSGFSDRRSGGRGSYGGRVFGSPPRGGGNARGGAGAGAAHVVA
eukprot:TRINITY_DN14611_c0_g1_i1.p1 TRINITY_DN14611_c0_g1~~TRINITY_DN14611_c0_g1_i1.p1  ORF type:complete len:418 (-),score=70.15 TRINITY_DN14611_c0_g1_i1:31-1146(-)